jgi:hypothetical protein
MNMIAHYHPSGDFAQPSLVRRSKHLCHHVSNLRVFEPHWTSVGCIELAIRLTNASPDVSSTRFQDGTEPLRQDVTNSHVSVGCQCGRFLS